MKFRLFAIFSTVVVPMLVGLEVKSADVVILAHRGLLRHAPENTLANFRACIELGLGFEFDVARTSDGHLVCIHDDSVDRTTNGSGKVLEMSLAKIRSLDAGGWFDPRFAGHQVPTIGEVFALIAASPESTAVYAVDLKAAADAKDVVELAVEHGVLDRLIFIGRTIVEPAVREKIKQVAPNASTAIVANAPVEFAAASNAPNSDWVYFRYIPTPEEIKAVHDRGGRTFIAGSAVAGNEPGNWRRAVSAGIDAILTDYPLELAATLRRSRVFIE